MTDEIDDDVVETVAKALYGGDDWDSVWQENAQFSEVLHDEYRSKARKAIATYRAAGAPDTRLLNILGRASNVVEISWSVPRQEPGSLIDTLLVAVGALAEAIAPRLDAEHPPAEADLLETLRRVVMDYAEDVCDNPETCDCSMAQAFRLIHE